MSTKDIDRLRKQINLLVRRLRQEQPAGVGISHAELHVLTLVANADGPLRPGQLSDELHMTTPNMAAVLRKLEKLHLVDRRQDATDGRQRLISVTEAGRALTERTRASRHAWFQDAVDRLLTVEERLVLFRAGELMQQLAEDDLKPRRERLSIDAQHGQSSEVDLLDEGVSD
jgi:DNA-binding MarR family transcriptional regulator